MANKGLYRLDNLIGIYRDFTKLRDIAPRLANQMEKKMQTGPCSGL